MSMNLTLYDRKTKERRELFQVPTEETFDILSKKDRYQAYIRWLRSCFNFKDPDDVIRYKEFKQELKKWLEDHPNHEWSYE